SSFATQYCDVYGACCVPVGKTYQAATCTALINAQNTTRSYDAAQGQSCLDALRTDAAQPTFCSSGPSSDTSTKCNGVFKTGGTGVKPLGQPCASDAECASSSEGVVKCATSFVSADGGGSATIRQCQVQVRAREGEECVSTKDGNTTYSSGSSSGPPPA